MNYSWILLTATLFLIGCTGGQKATQLDGSDFYGETFAPGKVISMDQLYSKLKKTEYAEATVKGKVLSVCQKKGCWMTLAAPGGEEMMVRFKDYGFFMPLDLNGEVVMKGKAYKQVTPVDELRHYAEDAGKSADEIAAITEPVTEFRFEATGVMIPSN